MLAVVLSRACIGIHAPLVTVEAHISPGLPALSIVGLAETAVKESKDRVRSAIINSGFEFPNRRITINLAPADLPKEGGGFDLPIALGILAASKQIPMKVLTQYEFSGELALSGELRPIHAALPVALGTRANQRALILPAENAFEASLPRDNLVYPARNLLQVCNHLQNKLLIEPYTELQSLKSEEQIDSIEGLDFSDIKGQTQARRTLEIAAAGGHSLMMVGPPGTGKTMLATRLPSILPELTIEEALQISAIRSITSTRHCVKQWGIRPFRAPHHTASSAALVGGGSRPRPGEITLAHHGVLFLDELPEFQRKVLEVLREPLESGSITISRAARQIEFPAEFQLITAMNPCPCGYLGAKHAKCTCTVDQVKRYRAKISGPLLDRIDLHIEVPLLPPEFLATVEKSETSAEVKKRVLKARAMQMKRSNTINAKLNNKQIESVCVLDLDTQVFLNNAMNHLGLSARSYHKILKIARTIADLADCSVINLNHLSEAIAYRNIDRDNQFN